MMITYWDLSEKERGELSRDDVVRYLDAELMTKGVLRPKPLVLLDETPPDLPTRTVYAIGIESFSRSDLAFETAEQAAVVAAMRPLRVEYSYDLGTSAMKPLADATIVPIAMPTSEALSASKSRIKEIAANKAENERRKREHSDAEKATDDALRGLWEDWHSSVAKAADMARVVDVFESYVRTAGGNETIAARFLAKAFPESAIREAEEWTGRTMRSEEAA